jgi:hypothetical protein
MDHSTPSTDPNGGPTQDPTEPVPAIPARAYLPPPHSGDQARSGDQPPPAIPRWVPADLPSGPAPGSLNAPSNPTWAPVEPMAAIAWAPPGPPTPPRGGALRSTFDEEREATSSRLRNVTVGLAAAGFVAVGGLAILAANGFTGVDTAATNGGTTRGGTTNPGLDPGSGVQPGASAAPDDQGVFGQPPSFGGDDSNGGGFYQPNNNGSQSNGGFFQPPSIGVGPGHASSGGS